MNTIHVAAVLGLTFFSAASAGCVQKGSSAETKTVADLSSYSACAINFDETGIKNGPKSKQVVMEQLQSGLSAKKVCEVKSDGDLTLKMKGKLEEVKDFAGGAGLGGKDFEAELEVELVETSSQKSLGAFTTKGNTKENGHTTIGGVDTGTIAGDKEATALKRAADQVVEFMLTKRKK